MKKVTHPLAALSIVLACGCGGDGPTAPSQVRPPTPPPLALVSPADGAVLSAHPRAAALQWTEVTDPAGVSYTVELELGYPGSADYTQIPQDSGLYGSCAGKVRATSCTTADFPGDQPGRWRVSAENGAGVKTGPTAWRTFQFDAPPGTLSTQIFRFWLPAGSRGSVVTGPVRAGDGPLEVTLEFASDHIVLACVGTTRACIPFGGRPMTTTFTIPRHFPAGPIEARVYFNHNYEQPPGDARGTVTFTYNAQ